MSPTAHFAVFWMAGLLTGTLLGWMLGRNPLTRSGQRPAGATRPADDRTAA
jgi:hypothetical protein